MQWDVKGDTTFGPFEPSPATRDEIERLADACTRGGMPTSAVDDARGAQWRKVIFNASTNPIGALTGLTHGRVCERPDLRRLVSGLVDEGKAVAAAQGIVLDADPEALIDHAAKPEVAYGHKASMLQDVEARRPTEVDWLNGGIVRFGREHGVPTPLNEAVVALIKGLKPRGRRARAQVPQRPRGDGRARPRRADRVRQRVLAASRARSPTSPASRSCTATPTSSCRGRRAADRLPDRGALRRRARTAQLEQVFHDRPGEHIARPRATAAGSASASTGSTTS